MTQKRWETVTTARQVYCSSSTDYFVAVLLHKGMGRAQRRYHINARSFEGKKGGLIDAPKYLQKEIHCQLLESFLAGKLIIAEGTKDGGLRTSNLRYHISEYLEQLLIRGL